MREVVVRLEEGDGAWVWERLSGDVRAAMPEDVLSSWSPSLDEWIGAPRRIVESSEETCVLEGPNGRLSATVHVDADRRITSIELSPVGVDGLRNIVVGSPRGYWNEETNRVEGRPRVLGEFYATLLGMRIIRDDWIKVGRDVATFPHLAFGDGWSDARPPTIGDAGYPTQGHLEILADDLDAAVALACESGASVVSEDDRSTLLADPFGHPVRLVESAGEKWIGCVVFDCDDPDRVAGFWSKLLDWPATPERSADRVVIAHADGRLPALAFERVHNYIAPSWGDPQRPEQIHLDLAFNDPAPARARAERLGAGRIPPPRGSCPVYTDPAGHPFCLCSSAGTEEPYVVEFLRGR
jgi:catechol 2,3-dioxygenase-like lactoylglutathione lyase family enzyme